MHVLLFFAGLCLGALGGFLLALLVLHGRAQSLAEEIWISQRMENPREKRPGGEPAWDRMGEWKHARPSTAANGVAE